MLKFIPLCQTAFFRLRKISKHLMLKFILRSFHHLLSNYRISKHLMLKFIDCSICDRVRAGEFQNILCWSLSEIRVRRVRYRKKFQNILCWSLSKAQAFFIQRCLISKHLMLKFIDKVTKGQYNVTIFQNILCWSLSCSHLSIRSPTPISKHLMLKFIFHVLFLCVHFNRFQNILCWSLSKILLEESGTLSNFKTSYVEVYLSLPLLLLRLFLHFKTSYVEVYPVAVSLIPFQMSFQNILCWSLSTLSKRSFMQQKNFKTSYVEVYPAVTFPVCLVPSFQNILCWSLSCVCSCKHLTDFISKHLMLKFIEIPRILHRSTVAFQNILCWSLSSYRFIASESFSYFKTSYVEVYLREFRKISARKCISKHLMLKFIFLCRYFATDL